MSSNGNSDRLIITRAEVQSTLVLDRKNIADTKLTAQELGILIYIVSALSDPTTPEDERHLELWDVLLRFPEDDAISTLMAIKRLIKNGYLEDDPNLHAEILNIMQEKYGVTLQ